MRVRVIVVVYTSVHYIVVVHVVYRGWIPAVELVGLLCSEPHSPVGGGGARPHRFATFPTSLLAFSYFVVLSLFLRLFFPDPRESP